MKQDDHKITFGLVGVVNKSDAIIESKEKEDDKIKDVLNKINQSILYPDVFDYVDLQYITCAEG